MPFKREKIFESNYKSIIELKDEIKKIRLDNSFHLRKGDRFEKNILTKGGLISNGFMGLHAKETPLSVFVKDICTSSKIGKHLEENYGFSEWKLVQTMTFDSNADASLHTDDIFLDASVRGCLVGMLISLEQMTSLSGGINLYDYSKIEIDDMYAPVTSSLDLENFKSNDDVYSARGYYLEVLNKKIDKSRKSPTLLSQGEVVSWSSYIPHESLRGSKDFIHSRRSIAAHYIPSAMDFTCLLGINATEYAERYRLQSIPIKS